MIVRQLKLKQYEIISERLKNKKVNQLEASCNIKMDINGIPYVLKMQLEHNRNLVILQAIKTENFEQKPKQTLITEGSVLSALLELYIYQET